GDTVVTCIRRKPELVVRFDGVEAFILQGVGAELVLQSDPAPFVPQVKNYPATLLCDATLGFGQLVATIAPLRPERVTRHAFRVDANQCGPVSRLPHGEGQVIVAVRGV